MFVNNRAWSKVRYDRAKEHISNFDYTPVFSILMPVYNAPEKWLRRAIDSVLDQIYPHWELCIADDRSTTDHVRNVPRNSVPRTIESASLTVSNQVTSQQHQTPP
ncbi:MAG: hypothetical protein CM1200mP20_05220 [Pseudomonadota bacterium]|nr:MAG: hypothetical protein CM1200mP20_05220 [Pseudomonadota bacterium]